MQGRVDIRARQGRQRRQRIDECKRTPHHDQNISETLKCTHYCHAQGFNLPYEHYLDGFELGFYDKGNWEFFIGLRRLSE